MSLLIVLAHPLPDSLCAQLASEACRAAPRTAGEPQLIDLYQSGFDPVLSPEERAAYGSGPHEDAAGLSKITQLVLVFPTWWFGPPAILKGWIDRSFLPGVAFDQTGPDTAACARDAPSMTGRLTGLRDVLIITTLGSPWWIDRLVMREPLKRTLKLGVFKACAPAARFRMISLYNAEQLKPARLARFRSKIQSHMESLK